MKMSTKGQYSLRAMVVLARQQRSQADDFLSITMMAEQTGVTERYLEKLLRQLKADGLIETARGAAGGFKLTRSPEEITVGEVLRAGEGELTTVSCVTDTGNPCARQDGCVVQYVWKRINDSINDAVDSMTLAELIGMKPEAKQAVSMGKGVCNEK